MCVEFRVLILVLLCRLSPFAFGSAGGLFIKIPRLPSLHIALLTVRVVAAFAVVAVGVAVAGVVFCCRCTITSNSAKLNEFLMHLCTVKWQAAGGRQQAA